MIEGLSGYTTSVSKKTFTLITQLSVIAFLVLIIPAITKYLLEKKHGKITKLSKDETKSIKELYQMLGYQKTNSSLLLTQDDDVDQGHATGSYENMEALIQKFHVVIKHQDNNAINISVPGSWKSIKNHHFHLTITINKENILDINKEFQQNSHETSAMIAALMDLAIGEYIEKQQSNNMINTWLAGSGHHSVDYNGNLLGIQEYFLRQKNNYNFQTSIEKLQKRYGSGNAYYLLFSIRHEFGFDIVIS